MNMNMSKPNTDQDWWWGGDKTYTDPSDISKTAREIYKQTRKEEQSFMGEYMRGFYMTDEEAKNFAISILEKLGYTVALKEPEKPIDLGRCSCCNSEDGWINYDPLLNLYHVECQNCGMSGPANVLKETAVNYWHRTDFKSDWTDITEIDKLEW